MVTKPIFCGEETSPLFDRIGLKTGRLRNYLLIINWLTRERRNRARAEEENGGE
jgi:hypothetical protein